MSFHRLHQPKSIEWFSQYVCIQPTHTYWIVIEHCISSSKIHFRFYNFHNESVFNHMRSTAVLKRILHDECTYGKLHGTNISVGNWLEISRVSQFSWESPNPPPGLKGQEDALHILSLGFSNLRIHEKIMMTLIFIRWSVWSDDDQVMIISRHTTVTSSFARPICQPDTTGSCLLSKNSQSSCITTCKNHQTEKRSE